MRIRLAMVPVVLLLALGFKAPAAMAAAEVHRLNVVISAVPTQLRPTEFNSLIETINHNGLEPRGLQGLDRIKFAWLFDGEVRYLVRQNLAVSVGGGRLETSTQQIYLPGINQSITLSAKVTSAPLHAGAAYYLRPYNQGDFQARAFVEAGFMSLVHNRATLQLDESGIVTGQAFRTTGTNDGPGYYGELGAHLFFASKYSVLLSGLYRSNRVHHLVDETTGTPMFDASGRPLTLDVGGAGFRMALGIGF
jgi:hypothetical protein